MNSHTRTQPQIASTPAEEQTFTIGQLAREMGITLRSIRFYEDEDMLHPARIGTTRIFSTKDRARLILICRGKNLGFSIKTIKTFLDLYESGSDQSKQKRFLLEQTQERIKLVEQQRVALDKALVELRQIEADTIASMKG